METIQIDLQCKSCGETFTVKKMCHTKLDAEIETRRISKRRNPVCPNCFKKEKLKVAIEKASKLGLPEIIGTTDKQISFAFSLRDRYIENNPYKFNRAKMELDAIMQQNIQPVTERRGYEDKDACMADAFRRLDLYEAYLCWTEPNASSLILYLKDCT